MTDFLESIVDPEQEEISLETQQAVDEIENLPILLGSEVQNSEAPEYSQDVIDDYSYARKLLIHSIEEAQRSLKEARKLFALTSNPKHGEVIVKLLKVISDNSDKLFKLHTDIAISKGNNVAESEEDTKKPQVIVATTAEVLAELKKA